MQPSVIMKNVTKTFGEIKALDAISFAAYGPGFVAIIGQSGSGKTTFLNQIGLLDCFDNGVINICGHQVLSKDNYDTNTPIRNTYVNYMFQDDILFNQLSVKDNVSFPTWLDGSTIDGQIIDQHAADLQVDQLLYRKPHQLSRGQRQRAALIRALSGNKRAIVLADEPTGNLDSENARLIFQKLKEISRAKLVIVATHDENLAMQYADRIVRLADGKITFDTKRQDLDSKPSKSDLIQPRLSFPHTIHYATADIKYRRRSLTKIIISTLFMLLSILLVFSAQRSANNQITTLESDYFNKNQVILTADTQYSKEAAMVGFITLGRYLNDYSFIDKLSGIIDYVCYFDEYPYTARSGLTSYDIQYVTLIKSDEYFQKKIANANLPSDIFQDDDTIILGLDVATALFGDDYQEGIGKKILLSTGAYSCEVTVVGINTTKDIDKHYQSFAPEKLYSRLAEGEALKGSKNNAAMLFSDSNCVQIDSYGKKAFNVNYQGMGRVAEYSDNDTPTLLVGDYPTKGDNEIIISSQLLQEEAPGLFGYYFSEDTITSEPAVVNKIIGSQLYLFKYGFSTVKIVGIFDNPGQEKADILCTKQVGNALSSPLLYKIELYLTENADFLSLQNQFEENGFIVERPYENYEDGVSSRFGMIKVFLLIISVTLIIISIVIICTFSSNLIEERKKDIGVLKALGANSRIIRKVFITEGVIISLISSVLCLSLVMLLKLFISEVTWFPQIIEIIHEIQPIHCLIVVLISAFVFISAMIPSFFRIRKIVPREAIYS